MSKFIGDCKHMGWLFKQMIKDFLIGNYSGANEAWFLIKLHWNYSSERK